MPVCNSLSESKEYKTNPSANIFLNGRLVSFEEWKTNHSGNQKVNEQNDMYPVIVPDDTPALLPGSGTDCGLIDTFSKRLVVCSKNPDHDHYEVGGTSCGRPACPRHWKTWARRAADRAGRIIWGYKVASKGRHNPRHTVLSLDDEDVIVKKREGKSLKSNLIYFRKYYTKKALSMGGTGGSMVIHLLRTNENVPLWVPDARRWDWVREQKNWKYYTKFSPHSHITGYGFYDQNKKWQDDFMYKNFDPLEDRDAVESVAYYQVQHALVGIGNVIVYWGCCQPGYLKVVSKGTERKPIFCKTCCAPMVYAEGGDEYSGRRSWAIYEIGVPASRKKKGGPVVLDRNADKSFLIWGAAGSPASANTS